LLCADGFPAVDKGTDSAGSCTVNREKIQNNSMLRYRFMMMSDTLSAFVFPTVEFMLDVMSSPILEMGTRGFAFQHKRKAI
jgi:hypothetical protein